LSQYNTTIEELIDQNVIETLQEIVGGPNFPFIATIQWARAQGNDVKTNTLILIPGSLTPDENRGWGHDFYRKSYTVQVPILSHQDDTQPDAYKQSNAVGAVIKALMNDVTRNDLAMLTEFQGTSQEENGVSLEFQVLFRTLIDDPFNES
jgi:hypothetical protein